MARPPGLRCRARRGDGGPASPEAPRRGGAGELGRGRGGRPRRGGLRRVARDASARFPGSAEERRFGSDGPGAWGAADRRPAPSGASRAGRLRPSGASRGVFRRLGGVEGRLPSALQGRPGPSGPEFRGVSHAFARPFRIMSDKATLSDIATPRQAGRISAKKVTKRRARTHHAQVIRADLDPLRQTRRRRPARAFLRRRDGVRERKRTPAKTPERKPFRHRPPVPAWARASGRAGEGDPLFAAGAGLALLDAFLRRDPPAAGALRARLALKSAAASRQDPAPQRRRRRAARPALRRWRRARARREPFVALARPRRPAAQPRPEPDPRRRRRGSTWLSRTRTASQKALKACAGEGDPVSAAAKAAALAFSAFPDAPAAEAEILALWVFDIVIAIRLRWPRPVPLIATKILDPSLRSRRRTAAEAGRPRLAKRRRRRDRARRRLRPRPRRRPVSPLGHPDRRRAQTARRNRRPKSSTCCSAEDCVSPAEAARQAPMTGRAARRLFDRLVALGAAREFSGRPTFRLYGL